METPATAIAEQTAISREIGTAVKHSFIYGFGGVFIKAIGFLLLPLYTHYLSPYDYGVLEIIDLSISLLGMCLNMGMMAAVLRYYGSARSESERRKILGTSFLFVTAAGIAVLLLGCGTIPKSSAWLVGPAIPSHYLYWPVIQFVIGYIATTPLAYLRSREASGKVVALDSVATLALLVLNVLFLASLKLGLLGMLLSPVIVHSVKVIVLLRWMWDDIELTIDWALLRRMLSFGTPLIISSLTMFTLNFSDRFFLKQFESLEVVGIYAVGYKFGYLLNFLLIQPFNMMWQARMYLVDQAPNRRSVIRQIFVIYSALLTFVALGLALASTEIIALMVDSRFAASAEVVPIVLLSYIILGIGMYLQVGMFLASHTKLIGVVSGTAAVMNLLANWILIRYFGMMGAAWATLVGCVVLAVGSYCCSQRVLPLEFSAGRVLKGLAVAIGLYVVGRSLRFEMLAIAGVVKSLLLAVFATVVWFGVFSKDEVRTVELLGARARSLGRMAWVRGWQ